MTGSSGDLERRMNCTQDWSPRTVLDSLIAVRNEKPSAMIAKISTPKAHPGVVDGSCGPLILCQPS